MIQARASLERKPAQNAVVDAFNGGFRDECLNETLFTTLGQARPGIARWRKDCNRTRPHSALGNMTPYEHAIKWRPGNQAAWGQKSIQGLCAERQGPQGPQGPDHMVFSPQYFLSPGISEACFGQIEWRDVFGIPKGCRLALRGPAVRFGSRGSPR